MARLKSFRCSILGIFSALVAGGCATESNTSMVGALPSPNFSGPVAVTPPPPVPIKPAPKSLAPLPKPSVTLAPAMAGIPRDWTPPVPARAWRAIVIHHSATPVGGAARFDREHREKGWDELGYDFVIGNGTDTGDGQVEVGSRWTKQKVGAHAKTPDNWYNEHGIGICLVGNFDGNRPSPAQMRSLAKLVAYMMRTYHIPADRIVGHGDTKATDCPGRNMSVAEVRRMAGQVLAASGGGVPEVAQTAASRELMVDVKP